MIMMYKRVLPQLLALLLLLLAMATAFGSIRAVAEDEPTPEPTAIPQEAVSSRHLAAGAAISKLS